MSKLLGGVHVDRSLGDSGQPQADIDQSPQEAHRFHPQMQDSVPERPHPSQDNIFSVPLYQKDLPSVTEAFNESEASSPHAMPCTTPDCSRPSWNGKAGESCCRTCPANEGRYHGEYCNQKFQEAPVAVAPPPEQTGTVQNRESTFNDVVLWSLDKKQHHKLPNGEKVLILDTIADEYKVKWNSQVGFIKKHHIQASAAPCQVEMPTIRENVMQVNPSREFVPPRGLSVISEDCIPMEGSLDVNVRSSSSTMVRSPLSSQPPFLERTHSRGPGLRSLSTRNARALKFNPLVFIREVKDSQITTRYQIDTKEFASGVNGKVFVGTDREFNNRKVVVKKVASNSERKYALFRREVEIMYKLDHPNICKLFETYEQGRCVYFVMEFCEGGELFDRVANSGTGYLSEATTIEFTDQIASALSYAHGMKVAHRDLKPENVCLSTNDEADNHVKVIDWGLSIDWKSARMKSAVGSEGYASPETLQADEKSSYSELCDMWSLGIMVYVMLCGRQPFWGSVMQQLNSMKKGEYPLTAPPWPGISSDAKDFIRNLLKFVPTQRMNIGKACQHRWLRARKFSVSGEAVKCALSNMKLASRNSKFFSVCVASAARQLGHRYFHHIHDVFLKLDANRDGVIDISELANGFAETFGQDSDQVHNFHEVFQALDLDGSGTLGYTEFCAAALGEDMLEQDNVLWASFKAFDVLGDDDKVTKAEITQVLSRSNMEASDLFDAVAIELIEKFDEEGLGYLNFKAWVRMMRSSEWYNTSDYGLSHGGIDHAFVVWVSLDPRTGSIVAYPHKIAKMIECSWQRRESWINLGEAFHHARVDISNTGGFFQRTPNGMRDVRRVEINPASDELFFGVSGTEGEYRFDDQSAMRNPVTNVSGNAINPDTVHFKEKVQPTSFLGMGDQLQRVMTKTFSTPWPPIQELQTMFFGGGSPSSAHENTTLEDDGLVARSYGNKIRKL